MIVANPERIAVHLSSDSAAKAGASLKPRAHAGTRLAAGGGTLLPVLSHDDRRAGPEARQPSHGRPRSSSGSSMNSPSSASEATGALSRVASTPSRSSPRVASGPSGLSPVARPSRPRAPFDAAVPASPPPRPRRRRQERPVARGRPAPAPRPPPAWSPGRGPATRRPRPGTPRAAAGARDPAGGASQDWRPDRRPGATPCSSSPRWQCPAIALHRASVPNRPAARAALAGGAKGENNAPVEVEGEPCDR